jgi:hypothetical protein
MEDELGEGREKPHLKPKVRRGQKGDIGSDETLKTAIRVEGWEGGREGGIVETAEFSTQRGWLKQQKRRGLHRKRAVSPGGMTHYTVVEIATSTYSSL